MNTKDVTYTMNGVEIQSHEIGNGASILKIGETMLTQTVDGGIRGTVYSQEQRELVEKALPELEFTPTPGVEEDATGETWTVRYFA